jgi:hypothetical protein
LQSEIDRLNDEKSKWILAAGASDTEELEALRLRIKELELENAELRSAVEKGGGD